MKREHAVSMSITNGADCICNPEVLLGTKYGLWDFAKEIAPKGTLLDLNAAWELFLSRKGLQNLEFEEVYHHQDEVIDGVSYSDGDTTYTLIDDLGNRTNATFTIKANKGPVEHIEWLDGNLILYYTKTRVVTNEDLASNIPLHYVYDENGAVVADKETGRPLIYDYVKIPIIEIFDNDETHKLFPWFADNLHTVRLRQNLDDDDNEHLGDIAITSDSEVFVAKERFSNNEGNTLISIQSIYNQLKKDLGFEPTEYENATVKDKNGNEVEIIDEEGNSSHLRVTNSNLSEKLKTDDKTSIIDAINETVESNYDAIALISGEERNTPIEDIKNYLLFNEYLLNHRYPYENNETNIRNILWVLNNLLHFDLGDFLDKINSDINASDITDALNKIFIEAENNKKRIGFKNGAWILLNTDDNENLTSAINEVDNHVNNLSRAVGVTESTDSYLNNSIHDIIKNRLRKNEVVKNNITIVEGINDLQEQIGNLNSTISNKPILTTDNKDNLVEAINEVDLHSDNNYNVIGADYLTNLKGEKTGDIINLNTDKKSTIVEAINELKEQIGDLSDLNTDDKTNLIDSINEVIKESPFKYLDVEDSNSGVILKDSNNVAGEKSLVIGNNNINGDYSFTSGNTNTSSNYSLVSGEENNSIGDYSTILGSQNTNRGDNNLISGNLNSTKGNFNLVHGFNNRLQNSTNSIVVGSDNEINCENIIALGSLIIVKENTNDSVGIGKNIEIKDSKSYALGNDNVIGKNSFTFGSNNISKDENNHIIGSNNSVDGNDNFIFGKNNISENDNNILIGKSQKSEGKNNILIGINEQRSTVDNAVIINGIENVHENATHIGKDIYIQTHETESKLQSIVFTDLNDWCIKNNAASLNAGKFLATEHVVNALKIYLSREYTDNALLRFKMIDHNENGYILVQGDSIRVYLKGSLYYTNDISKGWSRQEGTYLKVIEQKYVNNQGETSSKYYLAFMDLLSTEAIVDTVGAQRTNDLENVNPEDFGVLNLSHAYGAVDIEDINKALGVDEKLKTKVDKYASIITKYKNKDGQIYEIRLNFIDLEHPENSADIVLDLKESFGVDFSDYQLLSEKGQPEGYVPLNKGGLIDSQYLPSYVDDVIDVWAEYQLNTTTGAVMDIHLYLLVSSTVPTTGEEIAIKGEEILEGETGKIYVEANPSNRRFSTLFRWTGTLFVAIGFTNLTLGEVAGTAYEGSKGAQLKLDFEDHIKSGVTKIPVENPDGTYTYVTYKPNPHNVTPEQLNIIINDPNDNGNINLDENYLIETNVKEAILKLFNRINTFEDKGNSIYLIIGTLEEILLLDELDSESGNLSPTIIGKILEFNSYTPIEDDTINLYINDYFLK